MRAKRSHNHTVAMALGILLGFAGYGHGSGTSTVPRSQSQDLAGGATAAGTSTGQPVAAVHPLRLSPSLFVENRGQWVDPSIRYRQSGASTDVAMVDSGMRFQKVRGMSARRDESSSLNPPERLGAADVSSQTLRFSLSFVGAEVVRPTGLGRPSGTFHYCVGDPAGWCQDVPAHRLVAYENLYEGIDLHVQGLPSHLKYTFRVAPGSDPRRIAVRYQGTQGLSLTEGGALSIDLGEPWGVMQDEAPYTYQIIDGRQTEVASRFVLLDDHTYAFEIAGDVDPEVDLIIDPALAWSTYLGWADEEVGEAIAVDAAGNVYVAGWTFCDTGVCADNYDAFVTKLAGDGAHLWTTYVGGPSSGDGAFGVALDGANNVYVTGWTAFGGWATGGFDTTFNGGWDGFVVKLDSAGSHIWSTYLGGADDDYGWNIAVDSAGRVHVAGDTESSGWISGGYNETYGGGGDVFAVQLTSGGAHVWSTYLGGSGTEGSRGIALGSAGEIYVGGTTATAGWTSGGYDTTHNGGTDAFVAKLTSAGAHAWSTYLGGTGNEGEAGGVGLGRGTGIAVTATDEVYVTGGTRSAGWVSGGYDMSYRGGDGYVVRLTSAGQHVWSTYVGGASSDVGWGIAVDDAGGVYVTGDTYSGDGWVADGFDTTFNGIADVFVAKLSSGGAHVWSTYVGGAAIDQALGLAVDAAANVFVTGFTYSTGWISGGYDTSFNGGSWDAFAAKITPEDGPTASPVYRFWSPQNSRHFYTIDEAEKDYLIETYPPSVWTFEGTAYYAYAQGAQPGGAGAVYRFWSPLHSAHFYTIDEAERDSIIATYPPSVWTYEGTAFYAWPQGAQPAGTSPVYRFWSPLHSGHFYTISEAEKDYLIDNYANAVWTYEGIAWYAHETP